MVASCNVQELQTATGFKQDAVPLQDWQVASQSCNTLVGHGVTVCHGICSARLRLPQGDPCCFAPITYSFCELWATPDEELDDGQCAFPPSWQVQCSGQREDIFMVRFCSSWRVSHHVAVQRSCIPSSHVELSAFSYPLAHHS